MGAFKLWCWRRPLRVPWTARRSNQSILKEINPRYSLKGLLLKLQSLATWCKEPTHWKRPWCWERLRAGEKRWWQRIKWLDDVTNSMDMSLRKLRRWWRTGKAGVLQSIEPQRVGHDWTTEQQQSHGFVFLVSSPHPGTIHASTKSHLIRTKAAAITQEISWNLGCLCKLLRSFPSLSN